MERLPGERPADLQLVACTGCGLEADERFIVAEQWSWWADGYGKLVPFCPVCAAREFGHRLASPNPNGD